MCGNPMKLKSNVYMLESKDEQNILPQEGN